MILLIKLLLAHFLGDFLLQPSDWVKSKESRKIRSPYLFLHCLVHIFLILVMLGDLKFWSLAVALGLAHGVIDLAKLYFQKPKNRGKWFVIDQLLHIASIIAFWIIWENVSIDFQVWFQAPIVWLYLTAIVFLVFGVSTGIQVLMANWTEDIQKEKNKSLTEAGRYIGILERLLTFVFIVCNQWEAVGFLLAAKSVFRFGDLKESRDRKLTEYILIGTLLSFGLAILTGLMVLRFSKYL